MAQSKKSLNMFVLAQGNSESTDNIAAAVKRRGHDLTLVKYFENGQSSAEITDSGLIVVGKDEINPVDYDCAMLRSWGTAHRGAELLNVFEQAGVTVLNPTEHTKVMSSKVQSAQFFQDNGVSFPQTVICDGTRIDLGNVFDEAKSALGNPAVMVYKPDYGSRGAGIHFIHGPEDLQNAIKTTQESMLQKQISPDFILQEFLGDPEEPVSHFRIITHGDQCIPKAIKFTAGDKMIPSNGSQGAKSELVDIEPNIGEATIYAAQVSQLAFTGADAMYNKAGDPVVLEVNDSPAVHTMDRFGYDASGKAVEVLEDRYYHDHFDAA